MRKNGKIRILYLSLRSDLTRGGQRSLLHLIEYIDRDLFEPFVVMPEKGDLSDELEKLNVKFFNCPWPHYSLYRPVSVLRSSVKLGSIIRKVKPDIIHADAPRNTHLAWLASPRSKIVIHLRVADYDGFSDTLLAKNTTAMIAISHGVAERFLSFPKKVRDKITIIHNGVDVNTFVPVDEKKIIECRNHFDLPIDKNIVAFLASYNRVKRHDFFIDRWKEVVKLKPDSLLVLAGNGPEARQEKIRQRIIDENLQDHIKMMDFVSEPQKLLACCDLLVLPSANTHEEGFGRVLIEANSCGIPVIASDIPGCEEAVINNETGLLVEADSEIDWEKNLITLLSNNDLRKKMGEAGRENVIKNFSLEIHSRSVTQFYHKLLDSRIR